MRCSYLNFKFLEHDCYGVLISCIFGLSCIYFLSLSSQLIWYDQHTAFILAVNQPLATLS